jgi:hypothetical protein
MSSSRGLGPGPDGRHDDLLPDDLDGLTLHVPDDPRELASDRAAWLAEGEPDDTGASQLHPSRWSGLPALSRADRRAARRRRLSMTASVVLASMLVVAVSGAVGAWIVGPQAAAPPAAPLASVVPDPGQLGGLLPEVDLQDGSTPVSARSLRPAVITLVPAECDECTELLTALAPQVGSFGVSLVAVAGPQQAAQLVALTEEVGASRLSTLTDPTNGLRATYGLTGVTLLLVRDDGMVVDIVRDPTPDTHIEAALVELVPSAGIGA